MKRTNWLLVVGVVFFVFGLVYFSTTINSEEGKAEEESENAEIIESYNEITNDSYVSLILVELGRVSDQVMEELHTSLSEILEVMGTIPECYFSYGYSYLAEGSISYLEGNGISELGDAAREIREIRTGIVAEIFNRFDLDKKVEKFVPLSQNASESEKELRNRKLRMHYYHIMANFYKVADKAFFDFNDNEHTPMYYYYECLSREGTPLRENSKNCYDELGIKLLYGFVENGLINKVKKGDSKGFYGKAFISRPFMFYVDTMICKLNPKHEECKKFCCKPFANDKTSEKEVQRMFIEVERAETEVCGNVVCH